MTAITDTSAIVIRRATDADAGAIARLAALDSAIIPAGPLLLGEVDGEVWAIVPEAGGAAIADPFRPTAPVVALLRVRTAAIRAAHAGRVRRGGRGRFRMPGLTSGHGTAPTR